MRDVVVGSREDGRVRSWRGWYRLEGGSKKGRSRVLVETLGRLLLNPTGMRMSILSLGCVPVRSRSVRGKGLALLMRPFRNKILRRRKMLMLELYLGVLLW